MNTGILPNASALMQQHSQLERLFKIQKAILSLLLYVPLGEYPLCDLYETMCVLDEGLEEAHVCLEKCKGFLQEHEKNEKTLI